MGPYGLISSLYCLISEPDSCFSASLKLRLEKVTDLENRPVPTKKPFRLIASLVSQGLDFRILMARQMAMAMIEGFQLNYESIHLNIDLC